MVILDNITVALPPGQPEARVVLKGLSLSIEEGEWVALVGPNGSGKTTLLAALAGLVPPASGTVRRAREELRMALLLQEPDNQFVASSVGNELLISVTRARERAERAARVDEAVERFGLGRLLDRNPHRLSGGEKQRLALATVWLAEPDLLLLDEPTSYLDSPSREQCIRFVSGLRRRGVAVVWATPGGDDVLEAGRAVYIEHGEIHFDGASGAFFEAAKEQSFDVIPSGRDRFEPAAGPLHDPARAGTSVVTLRGASFAYGREHVLRDISMEVHAGECLGVTGRNGSGKSTLLSILSGIHDPTGGKIERRFASAVKDGQQNVFHLFQNPERMFFAETIYEEVAFGLRSLGAPEGEIPQRISEAISHVGLDPGVFLNRPPLQVSFGEMRRVAFAITLALSPKLVLLDEPASCLDADGYRVLQSLIASLVSDGAAVAVASSDADHIASVADKVIRLDAGRLV